MKKMLPLSVILKRITIVDVIVGVCVIGAIIFSFVFFLKKETWTTIEVKVRSYPISSGEQLDGAPNFWLSKTINVGEVALDSVGRKIAVVEKVKRWGDIATETWVTLKIKAGKNKSNIIRFNYQDVAIGASIKLQVGQTSIEGVVTHIEGIFDDRVKEDKIIKTRLIDWSDDSRVTLGVFPWVASSLKKGDQMITSDGDVVAEIMSIDVHDADRLVTTADGRINIQKDPSKKDVFLTLLIKTTKTDQVNYYLDDYPVKINTEIPFSTATYYVMPRIIEIP